MKTIHRTQEVFLCLLISLTLPVGASQKGLGDQSGIARDKTKPPIVSLAGELVKIDTHQCAQTTGPAALGTHLILRTSQGITINLHMGPSPEVANLAPGLKIGMKLRVKAFTTSDMDKDAYVAVSIQYAKNTVILRNPTTLRPVWAGKNKVKPRRRRR